MLVPKTATMVILVLAILAGSLQQALKYMSCSDFLTKLGICKHQPGTSSIKSLNTEVLHCPVVWMAPFFSSSGYGSEALSYVAALEATKLVPGLKIVQHGDMEDYRYWSGLPSEMKQLMLELNWKEVPLKESIIICHSEPGAWYPPLFQTSLCPPLGYGPGTHYVVGRTMFETDRLTSEHVKRCNAMDQVWVPSSFNMETFAKSGVEPTKLVKLPQTVDVAFFNPDKVTPLRLVQPEQTKNKMPFIFLSIFKWETRKGWDILLRAYLEEFSALDNVLLYMVTNPYHSEGNFVDKVQEFAVEQGMKEPVGSWPRLQVDDSHIPQVDMPRLYKAASAFVLPSRGEGWGRPHVEAMAMELPVIATNWSGNTEYMSNENSYLLHVVGLTEITDGPFKGHKWAEPCLLSLRRLMRHVVMHPQEAKAKGQQARQDMVSKYSPERVSGLIMEKLKKIA